MSSNPPTLPPHGLRLLLIDDDQELCRLTADYLGPVGLAVQSVHTGEEDVERALAETWHAVLLDVMLPDIDGFEVLKRIRLSSTVPVLMLTGRGEEIDRVVGLELGADDYLPKTFSSRELLARVRAAIRRAGWLQRTSEVQPPTVREIALGALHICPETHTAVLGEKPLTLTRSEFELLLALARGKGRVKTREQLFDELHGAEWDVFNRGIDMHVSVLRKKLGDDAREPRFIKTIRGLGYMLTAPEA